MKLFIEQEGNCSFNTVSSCRRQPSRQMRNCSIDIIEIKLARQPPLSVALPMLFMTQSFSSLIVDTLRLVPVCNHGVCMVVGAPPHPVTLRTGLRDQRFPCRAHNNTIQHCNLFTRDQFAYPSYQLRALRPVNDITGGLNGHRAEGVALWDGEEGSTFWSRLTWYSSACLNLG